MENNTSWPNEHYPQEKSYPPPSPYARFRQSQGLEQQKERSPLPLAQATKLRLPNTNDWSNEQKSIWEKKDPVEIERYYLNTHMNIKKMKKSPKGKPTLLIRKKREWRTGLANILVTNVEGWKPLHKDGKRTPTVQPNAKIEAMPVTVKTVPIKKTGTSTPTQTPLPSWTISSVDGEGEIEEEDVLWNKN